MKKYPFTFNSRNKKRCEQYHQEKQTSTFESEPIASVTVNPEVPQNQLIATDNEIHSEVKNILADKILHFVLREQVFNLRLHK